MFTFHIFIIYTTYTVDKNPQSLIKYTQSLSSTLPFDNNVFNSVFARSAICWESLVCVEKKPRTGGQIHHRVVKNAFTICTADAPFASY